MSAAKRVSDQQFASSKHRYTSPITGERLISVTSVVSALDTGDKLGAGAGAAVKITKAGGDYRADWAAKRELGTRVHAYAQRWSEGKSADVLPEDEGHMDAFASFCRDKKPEWLEVERHVISSLGYGGQFDSIAWWDDCFNLSDTKTGKPYKTELTLQLAGYRNAEGMIVYDDKGMAVAVEPMPHIDRCVGLYLSGDGTYDIVECDVDEAAFDAFKNLLSVKRWASTVGKAK